MAQEALLVELGAASLANFTARVLELRRRKVKVPPALPHYLFGTKGLVDAPEKIRVLGRGRYTRWDWSNEDGETALHVAAARLPIDGDNIDWWFDNTVFDFVCNSKSGGKAMVMQDSQGQTPLHVAAENGQVLLLDYFINCEAGKKAAAIKDNRGRYPLHILAKNVPCGWGSDSVKSLVRKNKQAAAEQDSEGLCPIHRFGRDFKGEDEDEGPEHNEAVRLQALKNVERETPGRMKILDSHKRTVLHHACTHQYNKDCISSLEYIHKGNPAAMTAVDDRGDTVLSFAAANRLQRTTLEFILSKYPQAVQMANYSGDFPLHCAAGGAPLETVQLLFDKFKVANRMQNGTGRLPWQCAKEADVRYFLLQQSPDSLSDTLLDISRTWGGRVGTDTGKDPTTKTTKRKRGQI